MSVSWKSAYGAITNENERRGIFELPPRYTSGQPLGIIAVDLDYPKVPGNVVNATTYDFPVLYEMVSFEIEQLFAGDPSIKEQVIAAAKKLEAEGVRAIIGACGYFAHFQKDVAAAVYLYSCLACVSWQLLKRGFPLIEKLLYLLPMAQVSMMNSSQTLIPPPTKL